MSCSLFLPSSPCSEGEPPHRPCRPVPLHVWHGRHSWTATHWQVLRFSRKGRKKAIFSFQSPFPSSWPVFSFCLSPVPEESPLRFLKEVALPFIKDLFAVVLRAVGPDAELPSPLWPMEAEASETLHEIQVANIELVQQGSLPPTARSCLVKTPYWIAQTALAHSVLQQAWARVGIVVLGTPPQFTPVIPVAAIVVSLEFVCQRFLFGISVLEAEIKKKSWLFPAEIKPQNKVNDVAGRLNRRCTKRTLQAADLQGVVGASSISVQDVFLRLVDLGLGEAHPGAMCFRKHTTLPSASQPKSG